MIMMDFGEALDMLKAGANMAREGWNGQGMWIGLITPGDYYNPMDLPYIYIHTAQGGQVPWVASQADLLADDWTLA